LVGWWDGPTKKIVPLKRKWSQDECWAMRLAIIAIIKKMSDLSWSSILHNANKNKSRLVAT
jgi:hypothetical protein